ncbi:MAG: RibD family protein [Cyanobium sp.]
MADLPALRLVLAVSLDGRLAPAGGGAAQLGGRGDRRVLEEALTWADGAMVGAETVRLHGSTCLIRDLDLLEQRRAAGLSPQPLALVVSSSGGLPVDLPLFRQPLERWLLAAESPEAAAAGPIAEPPAGFRRRLGFCEWTAVLAEIRALGLQRLVLLGGARLAASLLREDLVEELQLTLCPHLLGGGHTWIPGGTALTAPGRWQLRECRPLEGDELLLRYRREVMAQGEPPTP